MIANDNPSNGRRANVTARAFLDPQNAVNITNQVRVWHFMLDFWPSQQASQRADAKPLASVPIWWEQGMAVGADDERMFNLLRQTVAEAYGQYVRLVYALPFAPFVTVRPCAPARKNGA